MTGVGGARGSGSARREEEGSGSGEGERGCSGGMWVGGRCGRGSGMWAGSMASGCLCSRCLRRLVVLRARLRPRGMGVLQRLQKATLGSVSDSTKKFHTNERFCRLRGDRCVDEYGRRACLSGRDDGWRGGCGGGSGSGRGRGCVDVVSALSVGTSASRAVSGSVGGRLGSGWNMIGVGVVMMKKKGREAQGFCKRKGNKGCCNAPALIGGERCGGLKFGNFFSLMEKAP